MRRFVFPLLSLLVLAGCSDSTASRTDDVLLVPTMNVYAPGESVSALLFPRSEQQIGYGACSVRLEHLTGSQWTLVGPEEVGCIMVLYVLEPASARTIQVPLSRTLEPGTYRLRQEILPGTRLPARMIHSPEFQVRT
jgi:hypothetical protein